MGQKNGAAQRCINRRELYLFIYRVYFSFLIFPCTAWLCGLKPVGGLIERITFFFFTKFYSGINFKGNYNIFGLNVILTFLPGRVKSVAAAYRLASNACGDFLLFASLRLISVACSFSSLWPFALKFFLCACSACLNAKKISGEFSGMVMRLLLEGNGLKHSNTKNGNLYSSDPTQMAGSTDATVCIARGV